MLVQIKKSFFNLPVCTSVIVAISFSLFSIIKTYADEGRLELTNGFYIGEIKNGVPFGHGIFYWYLGSSFEGNWVSGKQHGHGTYISKSGKSTAVFYQYGELSIDYKNLPADYIINVCYLTALMMGDPIIELISSKQEKEAETNVVTIKYKAENDAKIRTGICKFVFNNKQMRYDMIEATVNDILFQGEEAKKLGQMAVETIFVPSAEELSKAKWD